MHRRGYQAAARAATRLRRDYAAITPWRGYQAAARAATRLRRDYAAITPRRDYQAVALAVVAQSAGMARQ
jgi:hypothetical protein